MKANEITKLKRTTLNLKYITDDVDFIISSLQSIIKDLEHLKENDFNFENGSYLLERMTIEDVK